MRSEKELFNLAKAYVMLDTELHRTIPDFDLREIKDSMEKIRNKILEKGYDVDKFIHYQQLYKEMSIGEHFEFVKTLE